MELNFNSVETIPMLNASAAFKTDSGKVFKEDVDIVPTIIDKSLSCIPFAFQLLLLLPIVQDVRHVPDTSGSHLQHHRVEWIFGAFSFFRIFNAISGIKLYLCE